jgi:hypothetical protein
MWVMFGWMMNSIVVARRVRRGQPPRHRIYTDGRNWPAEPEPSFAGYSIGHWVDEAGEGRFNLLEIETRYMKGPRTFEVSGLPLHEDNQTVVKERIFLDEAKPDLLYDHQRRRPAHADQEGPAAARLALFPPVKKINRSVKVSRRPIRSRFGPAALAAPKHVDENEISRIQNLGGLDEGSFRAFFELSGFRLWRGGQRSSIG